MLRSEIALKLANRNPAILRKDIDKIIYVILSEIIASLCNDEFGACEIRGLGRFSVKLQKARTGRNPASGSSVYISEKKKIRFKASSTLLKRLNEN